MPTDTTDSNTMPSPKSLMRAGAVLIYVGLALTVLQWGLIVYFAFAEQQQPAFPTREIDIKVPGGVGLGINTTYPGLILVAIGAILQVAAYIGSRPWKTAGKDE